MNYNEIVKQINEYILKFNQMIMAFAIGIIAFSIQGLGSNLNYSNKIFLYTSWASLTFTFFIGLIRMHHQLSVMTRNTAEAFNTEVLKKKFVVDEHKLKDTNKKSSRLYKIMMFLFCVGIISYAAFKITNLS